MSPRLVDETLMEFLGDELVQLPYPPAVPRFAAETVRPPPRAS